MPDHGLAVLADHLYLAAVVGFALAMLGFAFDAATDSRRAEAAIAADVAVKELVGAGGPADTEPPALAAMPPSVADPGGQASAAGLAAVVLTVAGWAVLAASLSVRGVSEHRLPFGNMFEFASCGAFAVTTVFLVLLATSRVRWLGVVVTGAAVLTLGLAGTVLYTSAGPLVPALHSYWLEIHVTAAIISSGILCVGSLAAGLYLLRGWYDRRLAVAGDPRQVTGPARLGRLVPDATSCDRTAYRVLAFGFPIWTFAIIAGAIWAESAWGRYWGWDPKETWAFITWVIYAAYLHARSTAGWSGRRAAWIAVIGFIAFCFNFFGVNIFIVGLHSYAGV